MTRIGLVVLGLVLAAPQGRPAAAAETRQEAAAPKSEPAPKARAQERRQLAKSGELDKPAFKRDGVVTTGELLLGLAIVLVVLIII